MRLSTLLRSSCVFGTALTVLGACSKGSAYTDSAQGTLAPAAPAPRDTTAATTAAAAAPGRDSARRMVPRKHGPLPPRAANALSEADVQDVIDVINGVDAQLSNPAVQKASNPQVKRFANELARTHRQRVTDRPVPVDNPSAAALVAPLRVWAVSRAARRSTTRTWTRWSRRTSARSPCSTAWPRARPMATCRR